MAKQVVVQEILTDDLDGSPAQDTFQFGWDGVTYEIELSKANARALEKVIQPYVSAARRARKSRARRPTAPRTGAGQAEIREWAQAAGYHVSPRGRIPVAVVEAYRAQHS